MLGEDGLRRYTMTNTLETFTEMDDKIKVTKQFQSAPEWRFFTVEFWLPREWYYWNTHHRPDVFRKYVDLAAKEILRRNGVW